MAAPFNLETHVQFLKSVGPARARSLDRLGIMTVGDLLARFPIRYEDRTRFRDVGSLVPGEHAAVLGEVLGATLKLTRRPGFKLVEATIRTDTGVVRAVWLNQPYMLDVVRKGRRVILFGAIERRAPAGIPSGGSLSSRASAIRASPEREP